MRVYIFTCVTFFLMSLSACGNSSESSNTSNPSVSSSAAKKAGASSTTSTFALDDNLIGGRKNKFKADLNGDGIEDSIFVVDRALIAKTLPAEVKLVQPWKYYGDGSAPVGITQGSKVGIYIQLGSTKTKSNYLITDVNSPSVLDTEAATELAPNKLSLVEPDDAKQLKKLARGDLVVIPTEAGIDTYLYWNGNGFAVFEPAEAP